MNKSGLSLLEVVVSVILLALLVTGIANTFISGKRFILHSRARMSSAEMGRIFLDYLQMHVRNDTWDGATNALATGSPIYCDSNVGHTPQIQGCPSENTRRLNTTSKDVIVYNATYDISDGPSNLRKVRVRISWDETAVY